MFLHRPVYFVIERRIFGIWWQVNNTHYDITFDTIEEAKTFLSQMLKKRSKTVVYETEHI